MLYLHYVFAMPASAKDDLQRDAFCIIPSLFSFRSSSSPHLKNYTDFSPAFFSTSTPLSFLLSHDPHLFSLPSELVYHIDSHVPSAAGTSQRSKRISSLDPLLTTNFLFYYISSSCKTLLFIISAPSSVHSLFSAQSLQSTSLFCSVLLLILTVVLWQFRAARKPFRRCNPKFLFRRDYREVSSYLPVVALVTET